MIKVIKKPSIIEGAGTKPKLIEEFVGRVNSESGAVSIARMTSPQGWLEPGQKPEFDEYTIVLKGTLKVSTRHSEYEIKAGEAIIVGKNEWVRYCTPYEGGAEYIAICLPAFSPDIVHRDEA